MLMETHLVTLTKKTARLRVWVAASSPEQQPATAFHPFALRFIAILLRWHTSDGASGNRRDCHLRREGTFILPPGSSTPSPPDPSARGKSCGCNEISYRFFNETQYCISFGPWFFLSLSFFFWSTTHTHTDRRENQYNPACLAKSNTRQFISIGFQSLGRCLFRPWLLSFCHSCA